MMELPVYNIVLLTGVFEIYFMMNSNGKRIQRNMELKFMTFRHNVADY